MLQKKDKEKILFFRESIFKIAELIFNSPNETFHLRKLANLTGLSTTAITSAIDELSSFKIVKVEKTDITSNIKADLDSDAYRFYKKIFNLYRLERYAVIDALKEKFRAEAIVLFGSFAKGEDVEESDIDILVITNHKDVDIGGFIEVSEKVLKRKINLQVLSSISESSKEFKNAIANGIVLHGYVKVI